MSSKKDKKVSLFFLKKCLQFSNDSGRLFSVMRDRIELEEVFGNEEKLNNMEQDTVNNWGEVPKGWTPEKELATNQAHIRQQMKARAGMFWFLHKRRQQGDWS
jgi:hypothetical protein